MTTESRSESPDNLAPEMLIKHPLQVRNKKGQEFLKKSQNLTKDKKKLRFEIFNKILNPFIKSMEFCRIHGPCGFSKMTRIEIGKIINVQLSPLTQWKTSGPCIITLSCHPSSALGVTTVYSRKVSSQCGRTTEIVGEVVGSSTSTKVKGRPSWTTFGWKLCFA